jgi:hypothetical protein
MSTCVLVSKDVLVSQWAACDANGSSYYQFVLSLLAHGNHHTGGMVTGRFFTGGMGSASSSSPNPSLSLLGGVIASGSIVLQDLSLKGRTEGRPSSPAGFPDARPDGCPGGCPPGRPEGCPAGSGVGLRTGRSFTTLSLLVGTSCSLSLFVSASSTATLLRFLPPPLAPSAREALVFATGSMHCWTRRNTHPSPPPLVQGEVHRRLPACLLCHLLCCLLWCGRGHRCVYTCRHSMLGARLLIHGTFCVCFKRDFLEVIVAVRETEVHADLDLEPGHRHAGLGRAARCGAHVIVH